VGLAREGVGHLRVWVTAAASAGYLTVVTETGEHRPAPGSGGGIETLDLVRVGADGSPHWSRVWLTPEENPRHAGLELWMAGYGRQIVGRPGSWFDWRDDTHR
jgi:hypothetical protein